MPKTPLRSVRVPDELWDALKETATAQGDTVSDVIRDLIREYLDRHRAT